MKTCEYCEHDPGYKSYDGDIEVDICACCMEFQTLSASRNPELANACADKPALCAECGVGAGARRSG